MSRKIRKMAMVATLICFLSFCAGTRAETLTQINQTQEGEQENIRYGKTNVKGVNVRKKPQEKADVVMKLPITGTAVIIEDEMVDGHQVSWYQVNIENQKIEGYIRSDLVDEITVDEYAQLISAGKTHQTSKHTSQRSTPASLPGSQNVASSHSGYAGNTTVWIENGIYHSDLACPNIENGSTSTLQTAQAQGLQACSMCWCYECLFGEE